ncbi:MAG TPA: hypothetical protein VGG40_13460 [Solirubrobacterales bacterium]|jgi:hypothetical protein
MGDCADADHAGALDQQDLEDEALVLDRVLAHWPTHLQDSDLCRELQIDAAEFGERDRIERAVHHLCWAGLVIRCGLAVVPTRAALHYHLLSDQTLVDL